jgi:hypothetical protein
MTTREAAVKTVVEYGIQTQNSKTILVVTEDLGEAESTLDMLGSGTLIKRTVRYGPWRSVHDEGGLTAAV